MEYCLHFELLADRMELARLQAVRVNALLGHKGNPRSWLSPRQLKLLDVIEAHPQASWKDALNSADLVQAWDAAQSVVDAAL